MPASLGQASSGSITPSPSVSFGGGHPFVFGSSVATPASSGQASFSSMIVSWSRSGGGGGQPLVFGSSVFTPFSVGHASSGSRMPSPSLSGGGGGGGGGATSTGWIQANE